MRQQPAFPADLRDIYSDAGIHDSFAEYGGIIRHVLPDDPISHTQLKVTKKAAIHAIDWMKYFACSDLEYPQISHLIINYVVT